MAFNNILSGANGVMNDIDRWGNAAEGVSSSLSSIISDNLSSADAIRDKYLNGFLTDESSFVPTVFSRIFDEPTYLTFRIEFLFTGISENNMSDYVDITTYDHMPMPLLDKNEKHYSTYNYLKNNLGEGKRSQMLAQFINELEDIQTNYPYYFTKLEGISGLSKIDPKRGRRLPNETKLTISCMEGLDLKITQLIQLYRKIVWDDTYQRWVLPDMMRYFKMRIYVSEIRMFHTMNVSGGKARGSRIVNIKDSMNATSYDKIFSRNNTLGIANEILSGVTAVSSRLLGENSPIAQTANTLNTGVQLTDRAVHNSVANYLTLCNSAINDVMPTICYECDMCEFDINETLNHINSLDSYNNKQPIAPAIVINVKNVNETQSYPLNNELEIESGKYIANPNTSKPNTAAFFVDDKELATITSNEELDNYLENKDYQTYIGEKTITSMNSRMLNKEMDVNGEYKLFTQDKSAAWTSLLMGTLNVILNGVHTSEATQFNKNIRDKISAIDTTEYNRNITKSYAVYFPKELMKASSVLQSTLNSLKNTPPFTALVLDDNSRAALAEKVIQMTLSNVLSTATEKSKELSSQLTNSLIGILSGLVESTATETVTSVTDLDALRAIDNTKVREIIQKIMEQQPDEISETVLAALAQAILDISSMQSSSATTSTTNIPQALLDMGSTPTSTATTSTINIPSAFSSINGK